MKLFRGIVKHFQRSLVTLKLEDHGTVILSLTILDCCHGHHIDVATIDQTPTQGFGSMSSLSIPIVLNGVLIVLTSMSYVEKGG